MHARGRTFQVCQYGHECWTVWRFLVKMSDVLKRAPSVEAGSDSRLRINLTVSESQSPIFQYWQVSTAAVKFTLKSPSMGRTKRAWLNKPINSWKMRFVYRVLLEFTGKKSKLKEKTPFNKMWIGVFYQYSPGYVILSTFLGISCLLQFWYLGRLLN